NPIENGAEINDHVNNAAGVLNISGTIIGGDGAIDALKAMRDSRDILTYIGVTRMTNLVFTSLKFDRSYKNRDGASFSASLKQLQLTSAEYVSMDSQMPMSSQDAGKNDSSQLAKTANTGMTTVSLQSVSTVAANRYEAAYTRPSSSAPLTRRTGAYDGLTITAS
ncbi:MAG: hypothetical protein IJL18_09440, partial [Synergistaceae bacterium]|nr:hypothetical protein [Synergistaceae bacterium]